MGGAGSWRVASVVADVVLGPDANVWYGAVIRGDDAPLTVGARTNVQDGAVIHADTGIRNDVAEDVTIGHGAIVHGTRVQRYALIGMGSVLLGRSVTQHESDKIVEIVKGFPYVVHLVHYRTMHLGPGEAILALKIHFSNDLDVRTLELKINEIEAALRHALPVLRRIYVEPGFDERQKVPA